MEFYLIYREESAFSLSFFFFNVFLPLCQFFEVMDTIIRYTDTSHFSTLNSFNESFPSTQPSFFTTIRCMQ